MKDRKIKISPKNPNSSKIHIKPKGQGGALSPSEPSPIPSVQQKSQSFFHRVSLLTPSKSIAFIVGGIFLMGFIFLIAFLVQVPPPSPSKNETSSPSSLLDSNLVVLPIADTLIKKAAFEQDITLKAWLGQFELSAQQLNWIENEFYNIVGEDQFNAGSDYQLIASTVRPQQAHTFIYEISPYDYISIGLQDSLFVRLHTRNREVRARVQRGVIRTNLIQSFDEKQISPQVLVYLEKVMSWKVDFFHLEPGDSYTLLLEEVYSDGRFVRSGGLKAACIRTRGKDHFAYYYADDEQAGYFDEQARPMKSSFLRSPLKYSQITSQFGLRKHPIDKTQKQHKGTDYAAEIGTDVYAVANGRITAAKFNRLNGNYITIDHENGYKTIYLHLDSFAPGIKRNVRVKQGQVIGYVGSTGKSTGPHLCFNLKKGNTFVNYLTEDLPTASPIPPSQATHFFVIRDSLNVLMRQ